MSRCDFSYGDDQQHCHHHIAYADPRFGSFGSRMVNPAILMLPAVLSASCAFMLPVATAPNAVVFGTGRFTTTRMMREGFGSKPYRFSSHYCSVLSDVRLA